MELSNEAMSAAGFSKPYGRLSIEYDCRLYPNEYSNTDWVDEIPKVMDGKHNVSARGGSERAVFMSYGYLDQDGWL